VRREAQRSSTATPPPPDYPNVGWYRAESHPGTDWLSFGATTEYGVFDYREDRFVVTGLHSYMHACQTVGARAVADAIELRLIEDTAEPISLSGDGAEAVYALNVPTGGSDQLWALYRAVQLLHRERLRQKS
jgi:hypothetical protein